MLDTCMGFKNVLKDFIILGSVSQSVVPGITYIRVPQEAETLTNAGFWVLGKID